MDSKFMYEPRSILEDVERNKVNIAKNADDIAAMQTLLPTEHITTFGKFLTPDIQYMCFNADASRYNATEVGPTDYFMSHKTRKLTGLSFVVQQPSHGQIEVEKFTPAKSSSSTIFSYTVKADEKYGYVQIGDIVVVEPGDHVIVKVANSAQAFCSSQVSLYWR